MAGEVAFQRNDMPAILPFPPPGSSASTAGATVTRSTPRAIRTVVNFLFKIHPFLPDCLCASPALSSTRGVPVILPSLPDSSSQRRARKGFESAQLAEEHASDLRQRRTGAGTVRPNPHLARLCFGPVQELLLQCELPLAYLSISRSC